MKRMAWMVLGVVLMTANVGLGQEPAVLPEKFWDGLVVYYTFDDDSRVVSDRTPARNDAEVVGNPEWATGAWQFDGVDSRIFLRSHLGLRERSVTIVFSVMLPSEFENGPFIKLGGHHNGYSIGVGDKSYDARGNDLLVVIDGGQVAVSSVKLKAMQWYQIRLTLDRNGNPELYVDGIKDGALKYQRKHKPRAPGVENGGGLHIGGCAYSYPRSPNYHNFVNYYTRCWIDDVLIFNREISGVTAMQLRDLRK